MLSRASFLPSLASLALLLSTAATARAAAAPEPTPLVQAHAHNDYEHTRPLLDALDQGFCSVEADIYLVDGQLLVAHDRAQVKPGRTLEALYLEPLRQRIRANGGRLFRGGPPASLLIDLKSPGEEIYPKLREVLARYRDILTEFDGDRIRTNAITVVLSGNRPFALVAADRPRYAALDGRLPDLDATPPPGASLVPWVSDNWRPTFQWNGEGEFPAAEKAKLKALVDKAHQQGRKIRFWGAPDTLATWKIHHDAGVDILNTDHLAELAAYLRQGAGR